MKQLDSYVTELNTLVKTYGAGVIAKLLGTTERGVAYWTAEEPKEPNSKNKAKIHELFIKHQSGENIRNTPNNDLRDELLESYKSQVDLLKDQLSFAQGELRHIAVMNFAMLKTMRKSVAQVLAKSEKSDLLTIADRLDKETNEYYRSIRKKGSLLDVDI